MTMPELTGFSSRSVPAILFCLLAFNSQAAMYKWVDEDGVTHYTQQPPPAGIEGKTIEPPPDVNTDSAQESLKERQKSLDNLQEERQSGEQEKKKSQEEKQAQKERCDKARLRLQSFQRPRVNFVKPDGTRVRATEEQRQAELEKAREYINENCK